MIKRTSFPSEDRITIHNLAYIEDGCQGGKQGYSQSRRIVRFGGKNPPPAHNTTPAQGREERKFGVFGGQNQRN